MKIMEIEVFFELLNKLFISGLWGVAFFGAFFVLWASISTFYRVRSNIRIFIEELNKYLEK